MGTASEAGFISIRVAIGLLFYLTKSLEARTKQTDLCPFFKNHAISGLMLFYFASKYKETKKQDS